MIGLSSYVSLVVALALTMLVTSGLLSSLMSQVNTLEKRIDEYKGLTGLSVKEYGSRKLVVINKTVVGEPVLIKGNYTVIHDSRELLVIETSVEEELIIVLEDDLYVV